MLTSNADEKLGLNILELTEYVNHCDFNALEFECVRCPDGGGDDADQKTAPAHLFYSADPFYFSHGPRAHNHFEVRSKWVTANQKCEELSDETHHIVCKCLLLNQLDASGDILRLLK